MENNKDYQRDEFISSFNTRIKLGLARQNIYTTEQLIEKTAIDLLHFPNLGLISVSNIVLELEKIGLKLKQSLEEKSAVYIPKKLNINLYMNEQKQKEFEITKVKKIPSMMRKVKTILSNKKKEEKYAELV